MVAGAERLRRTVDRARPVVTAVLGISAYRIAYRRAAVGWQPTGTGRSQLWVVPNPSGLNAHASPATLAAAYREVAVAAGVDVWPER